MLAPGPTLLSKGDAQAAWESLPHLCTGRRAAGLSPSVGCSTDNVGQRPLGTSCIVRKHMWAGRSAPGSTHAGLKG